MDTDTNERRQPPVAFRNREVEAELDRRVKFPADSRGIVASRDLERYYALLADAIRSVTLSEGEASLIVDACNGTIWDSVSVSLLWALVDDACSADNLDTKWGVNGAELVTKLRALSLAETIAVVDAAERFWARSDRSNESGESLADALRAVGLLR